MTRDLPFDEDDVDAGQRAGDTAYRVANGVARVARAGAYVTGGALVAANGGGTPAAPGSRLDSWSTGWAHNNSPDPDAGVPSPTVTFPDPAPSYQPSTHSPNQPVAHPTTPANGLPGLPTGHGAAALPLPGFNGTDAGMPLPGAYDAAYPGGLSIPGTGSEAAQSGGLTIPGTTVGTNPFDEQGGFGLPGHGLGQGGAGFEVPGLNGFTPGTNPFIPSGDEIDINPFIPKVPTGETGTGPFDGIGQGDGLGIFVGTQTTFDIEIGPQGVYVHSEMKVDVGVGKVGDQLDSFTDWLGGGLHVPDGSRSGPDQQHGTGAGLGGGTSATGTGVAQPVAPAAATSAAPTGTPAPAAATAPAMVAPAVAPAPAVQPLPAAQPLHPAAVAPVPAAIAPVVAAPAVAQPVTTTPLQTTIQPDAANTPIANVFGPVSGPSPLTAPAAAVPALFEQSRPEPVKPIVVDTKPIDDITKTVPPVVPTTVPQPTQIVAPPTIIRPPDATVPKTPDLGGITKTPVVPVTPNPGAGTGTDLSTKPSAPTTGNQSPGQSNVPTRPGGSDDGPSTGTNPGAGTGTQPTRDMPTREVPTVTVPTDSSGPGHVTQPTQAPVPTHAPMPTVDPKPHIQEPIPTMHNPVPVTPIKPIDPRHPIADVQPIAQSEPALHALPIAAQSTYGSDYHGLAGDGLSSALLPAEPHHPVAGELDSALLPNNLLM